MCWLSEDFPEETVAACGQTFGSYRGLKGHWKFIRANGQFIPVCWLSEDFPKETVAACGQTFWSYRGLTGHWKFIQEPTVNLYQCAGCQKIS